MSYTEIYSFDKDGNADFAGQVQNAWRGGMAVWTIMEKRYLPPYIPWYIKTCNWYYPGISPEEVNRRLGYEPSRTITLARDHDPALEIWNLVDNLQIPLHERIVMFTTFNNCLVKKEDIKRVVDAFRAFDGETSLKEQADILEELSADPDVIAVGWNGNSVNGDNWSNIGGYDEENDDYIPYNCLIGDKHYWLFDELKEE